MSIIDLLRSRIVYLRSLFGLPDINALQSSRDFGSLVLALTHKRRFVQRAATRALVELGEAAVDPLISIMKNGGPLVKESAAEVLGLIKDPRAVDPLINFVKLDEVWQVRSSAARALGSLKDSRAVLPLFKVSYEDPNDMVTIETIKALGEIGDYQSVTFLLDLLTSIGRRELRLSSVMALGKIRDKRAILPLQGVLIDWGDLPFNQFQCRSEAAKALDKLGWTPDRPVHAASYYITKKRSWECVKIGKPAILPLVFSSERLKLTGLDERDRADVRLALSAIAENGTSEQLLNRLDNPDYYARAFGALYSLSLFYLHIDSLPMPKLDSEESEILHDFGVWK